MCVRGRRERVLYGKREAGGRESSSFSFPVVVFMLLFELILFRCVLSERTWRELVTRDGGKGEPEEEAVRVCVSVCVW